jgi:hypothetical protein
VTNRTFWFSPSKLNLPGIVQVTVEEIRIRQLLFAVVAAAVLTFFRSEIGTMSRNKAGASGIK